MEETCTAALNASNEWLITIGCGSQTEETAALNASNEWLVTIGCGSQTEETAALNASNEWLVTIGCGSQTEETAALNVSNEWLVTIGCGSQTEETAALNVSNEPLVTTGCGQPDRGDSSFECLKWATHNYWLWQPVSVSTREKRFLSLLSLTRSDNEKERVHAPSLSQGYHKSGFIL